MAATNKKVLNHNNKNGIEGMNVRIHCMRGGLRYGGKMVTTVATNCSENQLMWGEVTRALKQVQKTLIQL